MRYMHCGQCNIKKNCTDQCVYFVNIPEPVQYKIYALALPFDLRCESGTLVYIALYINAEYTLQLLHNHLKRFIIYRQQS